MTAKKEPEKKKPGNPSKYNPDQHPFMAWALAIRGRTNKEIAASLRISTATLFSWAQKHEEFMSALKSGKDSADAKVENSLFMRAFGYEYEEVKTIEHPDGIRTERTVKQVAPDVTAQIFWLKNRRSSEWRDVQKLEHSGPDGQPLHPKQMSDDEIIALIRKERAAK